MYRNPDKYIENIDEKTRKQTTNKEKLINLLIYEETGIRSDK